MSDFTKTRDEVLKCYSSNTDKGLSEQQAKENIEKFGSNSLTKKKADSLLKRIWDASTEPMLLMLIAAGIIALVVNIIRSFTGGEADYLECVGVFAAIALSVVISVVMEGKSAKAFEALSKINGNLMLGQSVTAKRLSLIRMKLLRAISLFFQPATKFLPIADLSKARALGLTNLH